MQNRPLVSPRLNRCRTEGTDAENSSPGSEFRDHFSAQPPRCCFIKREQINAAEHQPSRREVDVQSHQLRLKGASAERL